MESTYIFILFVLAVTAFRLRNVGRRPKGLPPGPDTLPLIGNLHQIPQHNSHLQFQKRAKKYGPIYSVIFGTKVMIVLSSDQSIRDLLDKRSNIYSSRPEMYIGNIISGNLRVVLMIMQSMLNIKAAKSYIPYQDLETKHMLAGLLQEPESFISHIRRFSNSLATQMIFGFRTTSIHDKKLKQMYKGVEDWSKHTGSTAAALLDVYPIREGASYETAATLVGFMQAMLLYPEVQKLAREELDRICGERLPTLDDWSELPYIRHCVKESLRWMPVAILGIPHATTQDDQYMGYHIPKGAGVISNVWAIHMDLNRYNNPRAFDPSRYDDDDTTSFESTQNPDVTKRDHFGFGAGRRVCQGMHIADRSLFLGIARLLWAFNLDKAVGVDGEEIVPDPDDLVQGFLAQPHPFPAQITVRSEAHANFIRTERENCQSLLDGQKQWTELPKDIGFSTHVPGEKV
ncbi:cytochrome P450 [Pleomassaria siparia CBS 279.74]|uniref:Cytochrome P450 n=1 Tax=Pleomassaria siparia CBS 279.74 TaxID=1314801 RepID=A0A6G1JSV0_9PLEO|nr:cytochrome P450 [Pleomassaria siparia CBS 279.74]